MSGDGTAVGEHNVEYIGDVMCEEEGAATTTHCGKADPPLLEGAATTTHCCKADLSSGNPPVDTR